MNDKTCTNCPGATDHDTAHCPLRVIRLGALNPEQRLALARGHHPDHADDEPVYYSDKPWRSEPPFPHPEQAEGAQGERETVGAHHLPGLLLAQRECRRYEDMQFLNFLIGKARAALAQPSPAPDHFTHSDKKLEALLNATALVIESPGHDAAYYWAECMREYDEAHSPAPAPELERPEVVAYVSCSARMTVDGWENGDEYAVLAEQASDAEKRYEVPLMTVAQHDRIVGALRFERDSSREAYLNQTVRLLAAEKERDTAQAGQVREGWALVPIKPLLNMMSDKDHDTRIIAERQLLAVLDAAPVAQAGQVPDLERALAGMLFAFDDGVGQDWSADLLDFARKLVKAKEFAAAPAQGGE